MGRAEIISDLGDGQYRVMVLHDVETATLLYYRLLDAIALVDQTIALEQAKGENADADRIAVLKLRRAALQKEADRINEIASLDHEIIAWCADYSEGLTGEIGTIDIATDPENGVNIRPAYEDSAAYSLARDGDLTPFLTMPPASAMLNYCLAPAIQKWRPTYRYGTISSIDHDQDTCSVALESAFSRPDRIGLNPNASLSDVPIEYMSCNSVAFEVGDAVIVEWRPYHNSGQPTVIGFKSNPQPCASGPYIVVRIYPATWYNERKHIVIWDVGRNDYAEHELLDGITWPASWSEVEDFHDIISAVGDGPIWANRDEGGETDHDFLYSDPVVVPECGDSGTFKQQASSFPGAAYTNTHSGFVECDMDPDIDCEYLEGEEWAQDSYYKIDVPAYHDSYEYLEDSRNLWRASMRSHVIGNALMPWNDQIFRLNYTSESYGSWEWFEALENWCTISGTNESYTTYKIITPFGEAAIMLTTSGNYFAPGYGCEISRETLRDYWQGWTSDYFENGFLSVFAQIAEYNHEEIVNTCDYNQIPISYSEDFRRRCNVIASYAYYNDETGITGQNPANTPRRSRFETAVEEMIIYFYENYYDINNPDYDLSSLYAKWFE